MRITLLIHLLGLSLLFLGATMFLSLGVSWYYQDEAFVAMLWSCGLTVGIGSILTLLPYERSSLERREGLVAVPVLWCMVTLFGSLPFLLSGGCSNIYRRLFRIDVRLYDDRGDGFHTH